METTIIDHHPETPSVTSFKLEKPAGFTYLPGQFINVELPVENCDARCNKRNFSLVSSPTDDFLMFATRHGVSRFKQTNEVLKKGDKITFTGPFGRFVFNEDASMPAVFLSGGIGITPVYSMIKYATDKKLAKPITLIYSNTQANDIPFKAELDQFVQLDQFLTIHHAITDDPAWKGLNRRIDEAMIKELTPDWEKSEFYVCGPPQMVLAMKQLLVQMNIPVAQIKSELFAGY